MKARSRDWYKQGWSLDIKTQSWVENTPNEVDFIIDRLGLRGGERILDLACGYGRHALELARRGYSVVGVDITKAYVDDGNQEAQRAGLSARFEQADIRDVRYENAFDVVLSLADGAIGYLENDAENLKIFDVIARALKRGGKHFMDVGNAEHAEMYFPIRNWEVGEQSLALSQFEWDAKTHTMLFGGYDVPYGQAAQKPDIPEGDPTRLYSLQEIRDIMAARGMRVIESWSSYLGAPLSPKEHQMMVFSQKDA